MRARLCRVLASSRNGRQQRPGLWRSHRLRGRRAAPGARHHERVVAGTTEL